MEQKSQSRPLLRKTALDLATACGTDYMITLIKAMNPEKLSPADIEILENYLEEE